MPRPTTRCSGRRLCVPGPSAINARTGKVAWRKRGFALANLVAVGDRVIILEDEGTLSLATLSPEGITVHAKGKILEPPARTPPTIAGTRLYARDFKNILALDLG